MPAERGEPLEHRVGVRDRLEPAHLLEQCGPGGLGVGRLPDTEIFLAPLSVENGVAVVGAPVNVTRHAGYDNQPSFTPDGAAILYTSQRDGQTDVYRYDLRDRSTTPLTDTPESEYSPAVAPDGRSITVVRVEADSAQRLWEIPVAVRQAPRPPSAPSSPSSASHRRLLHWLLLVQVAPSDKRVSQTWDSLQNIVVGSQTLSSHDAPRRANSEHVPSVSSSGTRHKPLTHS